MNDQSLVAFNMECSFIDYGPTVQWRRVRRYLIVALLYCCTVPNISGVDALIKRLSYLPMHRDRQLSYLFNIIGLVLSLSYSTDSIYFRLSALGMR
jgi:hypothetical protein